jgi:hypothetical protein
VGNNGLGDCYLSSGSTNPGLVVTTCTTSGIYNSGGPGGYGVGNISDAAFYNGVTLAGSFVGKVTADDSVNASDTNGQADYPADPDAFDWANFENAFRGWGLDGTFGQADSRGRYSDKCSNPGFFTQIECETNGGTWNGAGRIWDWSLTLGDTGDGGYPAILGVLTPLPTGYDTLTHTWSAADSTACSAIDGTMWGSNVCSLPGYYTQNNCVNAGGDWTTPKCYSVFLRNAVELEGYGGNENTLCESGETCLYMPNIGSYQGHGSLISAGAFTDGTPPYGITGVTLMKYETNGY